MLVEACLSGDQAAFAELVDRYQRRLYNAAYRITGSREDALDATQTSFVKAYEKLATYNPAYRFFSWIYRIVVNESLNLVKRQGREAEPARIVHARTKSPEEILDESETRRQLQQALMELPPDHRVVLILRHFQGLSYSEIADILKIAEKTVKSRLFEARRKLRLAVSEQGLLQ